MSVKNSLFLVFLFALLLVGLQVETKAAKDFVNVNLHQVLDLTGSVVRSQTTVHVENKGSTPLKEYTVILGSKESAEQLVYADFFQKAEVKATPAAIKSSRSDAEFKLTLRSPLKPGEKTYIIIKAVYHGPLQPFPREVEQNQAQALEFLGNVYFYSPYASLKQKTTVKLPNSQKPLSFTKDPSPVAHSSKTIVYGPYENVPALSQSPLYVHFYSPNPILVASEIKRTLQVSHWAKAVNFLEYYTLFHRGASLKGHFSRVDYILGQENHGKTNVVKGLRATLPANCKNVFYRDDIGNVSTSHMSFRPKNTILDIAPRYPLYGGWRYKWHQGYDAPLATFQQSLGNNRYSLQLPFTAPIADMLVENMVVSIILPEGATHIRVDTPFPVDSKQEFLTFTYLDTTGHPTITLEKKNVVDEFVGPILVTYQYDPIRLYQKPLAVAVALFAVFIALSIYMNIDLSIVKDPKKENAKKLYKLSKEVSTILDADEALFEKLAKSLEDLKANKNQETFKKAVSSGDSIHSDLASQLSSLIKSAEPLDARFAKTLATFNTLLDERYAKLKSKNARVAEFVTSANPSADKKKEILAFMETSDKELKSLASKLGKLADEMDL